MPVVRVTVRSVPHRGPATAMPMESPASARRMIRQRGARSADEKPADYPNCRIASFEDPEGNKVGLHQVKAAK